MITPSKKEIDKIVFSVLSPEKIRKMSATRIITPDTYDEDGFPIEMGLMDTRLGIIEPGLRCKTCGQRVKDCPGHFGHIELAMPVIHVGFAKMIYAILKSTCRGCGHLLLDEKEIKRLKGLHEKIVERGENTSYLIKEVVKRTGKVSACPHCGRDKLKVEFDKPTTFREGGHKMTPAEVREWLEKVSEALGDNLRLLDINPKVARPEWMVLTVLPVPPVTTRPSITLETGERSEDDLTHKLVDIIRINQRLQENRDAGAPQLIVEDLWELLQYHVTTYFDNQTSGIPPARHRSGRALKTLAQRLKGKEGRFRSNLSGKRVNFSARTVISPDPNISINEVGVPIKIARELTVPVRVTPLNIEEMRELVKRGTNPKPPIGVTYIPGVNYIIRPDDRRIKVTDENAETVAERLEVGSIIERQLQNGDIVLFNRQPSLHRMSMMAHKVRVLPYRTFRLNLAVCPPYNADFDGDEMNMHVLQTEEARAEAEILMKVQEHILSPRFGGAIIGAIHDHISGCFLLTYKNREFSRDEAIYILSAAGYKGAVKGSMKGKEIFSRVLPPELNLEYTAKACIGCEKCLKEKCPYDAYVIIKNGKLITGAIDEKSIGSFKGEILEYIARKFGNDAAREFIDRVTKLSVAAIMIIGFTTGIDDEDIPEEASLQIREQLDKATEKIQQFIKAYNEGELEQIPGRSLEETLEMEIMRVTGRARDYTGEIASKHLGMDNSAVIMARSGARGSMLNLSQMAGCVGQQAVRGERIHRGYGGRTLPHFKKGDLGAQAKGFVSSSYKRGLNPTEYFFHSMGGREGLVDTAVRTSRSGYMQRRLVNALENIKLERDGTVRATSGEVIQFVYGEDGIEPMKSIKGKATSISLLLKEVEHE
ncbi:MAG TPA: DNA-directed RNA polymerase subunit A' [Thermoplasmatales archaeon]|nr:MAG: DNA-directed RNA polymerase subunit A' [Thermoplasmata archaeon]HDN50849.1 DNA-directed RNA polymerase subunit A' [Thermoplasmatales archaeon]